jgi:arsenate reductase
MPSWALADPKWSDDELIDFMMAHRSTIKPADRGDAEGRTAVPAVGTRVDLLDNPIRSFVKEGGEAVARAKR